MPYMVVDRQSAAGSTDVPVSVLTGLEEATGGIAVGALSSPDVVAFDVRGILDTSYVPSVTEALEQKFRLLAEQWRRETGMLSSISRMAMHPDYQRIIGMGERAISPILRELRRRPDHWFWALNAITGENPVPAASEGNIRQMAEAWVQWGHGRGYI